MIFSENRFPPSDRVQGHAFRDHALEMRADYRRAQERRKFRLGARLPPPVSGALPLAAAQPAAHRLAGPFKRAFDRLVGKPRSPPTIDRAIERPHHYEHENTGADDVGEESPAAGYAQHPDAGAEG